MLYLKIRQKQYMCCRMLNSRANHMAGAFD